MGETDWNAPRIRCARATSIGLAFALYACAADNGNSNGFPIGVGGAAGMFPGSAGASAGSPALGTAGGPAVGAAGMPAASGAAGNLLAGRGAAGGGGMAGATGRAGSAGRSLGIGGMSMAGIGGAGGSGAAGAAGATDAMGETGRLVGMTAAHNAVRAMVQTQPALSPLTWSTTLAAYAQEWADNQAMTACANPQHRSGQQLQQKMYGENLAVTPGGRFGVDATAATDAWAGEVSCYTFGTILGTEKCVVSCYMAMSSDGCGHYTQIVWRNTKQVGCGVATCSTGGGSRDIWICNYSPPGNVIGMAPY